MCARLAFTQQQPTPTQARFTARLRFFTNLFLSWWKHRRRSNLRCTALRSPVVR